MGFWDLFKRKDTGPGVGHDVAELARRLDVSVDALQAIRPEYREFTVPKRAGGTRRIAAPSPELKAMQRRIVRRLLRRLRCHFSATGFERGHSIVSNAACHVGQAVVVRMDLKTFFDATRADRVEAYFRAIGWNREASGLLARLCTHRGGLPQGAPTSPRLSNLVNTRMDARLSGVGRGLGAMYSRYADDLTFSFATDEPRAIRAVIRATKRIVGDEGYTLHQRRKLRIRRRHQQQCVTGLVVNDRVGLPRATRRWLRAVRHHVRQGRPATLRPAQLAGWNSLAAMVAAQSDAGRAGDDSSQPRNT
jgi:RNA-directed DNA polymerase